MKFCYLRWILNIILKIRVKKKQDDEMLEFLEFLSFNRNIPNTRIINI